MIGYDGIRNNRGCEYEVWNNALKHHQCLSAKVMSTSWLNIAFEKHD